MSKLIVVTGGREYRDRREVRTKLEPLAEEGNVLVVGGARGADELARRYWHYEAQLPYIVDPARWNKRGKRAGHERNRRMLEGLSLWPYTQLNYADLLVPFPGGRGTANACAVADQLGIPFYE